MLLSMVLLTPGWLDRALSVVSQLSTPVAGQ